MEELQKKSSELKTELDKALERSKFGELSKELNELNKKSQEPDFWSDNKEAQKVMQRQSQLNGRLEPWQKLKKEVQDLEELASLKDETLLPDLESQLKKAQKGFDDLKSALKLSGPYDDRNAIVSLFAGAGGTDAQDWTEMLLRMYVRWAEKQSFKITTVEQAAGEEAGIKSATLEIDGDFAYGKLKGENGVHRLVRLSPFNADHLRQTSFAKVDVLPKIDEPEDVELDEKDLRIDVYRSGGHGGQSVNTTDSAVRITHLPTGITVAIQNERSQLQNKEMALTILRSRLIQLKLEQHAEKISELKGPNEQAAWGNQIRSYVLHPYKQVKDLRTGFETSDPEAVLDGNLDGFITSYLEHHLGV